MTHNSKRLGTYLDEVFDKYFWKNIYEKPR